MTHKPRGLLSRFLNAFAVSERTDWESVTFTQKYEAKLYPSAGDTHSSQAAKLAYVSYGQGHSRFAVDLKNSLDIPESEYVQVYVNDEKVCDAPRTRSKPDFELDSRQGVTLPVIRAGQEAVIAHRGKIVLRGTFARAD